MGIRFFELVVGQDSPFVEDGDSSFFDPFPICHLRTGEMIFILGRVEDAFICDQCTHTHSRYFIQGLFSEQQLAEDNALDEDYFVGPLPLNMALPHDPIDWHGLYWPLQKSQPQTPNTDANTKVSGISDNGDVNANAGSLTLPNSGAGGDSESS